MRTSSQWVSHFKANAQRQRVDWSVAPLITDQETATILRSLQAWQLGETSDGRHLMAAAKKYAVQNNDPGYIEAIKLFIKEEQKHGNNLGIYLDRIGQPRIKSDLGDSLFRKARYFNTSMEIWTLTVITVESAAQIYYQALKDATNCTLLKQICTDILIDEAYHIDFQAERFAIIFAHKSSLGQSLCRRLYYLFYAATTVTIWIAHHQLLAAGGNSFKGFLRKMWYKYNKTIHRATTHRHTFSKQSIIA